MGIPGVESGASYVPQALPTLSSHRSVVRQIGHFLERIGRLEGLLDLWRVACCVQVRKTGCTFAMKIQRESRTREAQGMSTGQTSLEPATFAYFDSTGCFFEIKRGISRTPSPPLDVMEGRVPDRCG